MGATLVRQYLGMAEELHDQGGFLSDEDYASFVKAVHECIADYEDMTHRFSDDVMERLMALDTDFAACRREGHVWSRFFELSAVPKGMFGAYAMQRVCTECKCKHARAFTRGGRKNQDRREYEVGYLIHGVTKTTRIYQRHMWALLAKKRLDGELSTCRRRAAQMRRHLKVAS